MTPAERKNGKNGLTRPQEGRVTPTAILTALGIVYGDLGTSPLYTFKAIAQAMGGAFDRASALGSLSLIFWALIITISIKYCMFVMRADNHGEGGILALMSLSQAKWRGRKWPLIACGLFGAALIYGDGIITPAISVLSALEGLNVATDAFVPHVMPMAAVILLVLFSVQRLGTGNVAKAFGPAMLVWFMAIAVLGLLGIWRNPAVLTAADPRFAIGFLASHGWLSFVVLGAVFLAVTGGEALYADMGNVGPNPIRIAWFALVLPALLLNYAGQTALFLGGLTADGNSFFALAPSWSLYPLVALATLATIIASQAIITGVFSLTRQAMQLGWFPGVEIRQTSSETYGQIYVPFVNWTMMALTIGLTISFRSSDRLAGAYGTAVSTTMLLTTVLLYEVMRKSWRWPVWTALPVFCGFLVVDFVFFGANLLKIRDGGWIPLLLATMLFIVMTTWRSGTDAVRRAQIRSSEPLDKFLKDIEKDKRPRVPGTAVFLTRMLSRAVPPLIMQHVRQIGAIPEILVALSVRFVDRPRVGPDERLEVKQLSASFWHLTLRYGFVEVPDLPATLGMAGELGCALPLDDPIYFAAHDDIVRRKGRSYLWRWQRWLFAFMYRNSTHAEDRFNLPAGSFVEITRRMEV
jgi:KUP system potassium uptake protein